MKAKKILDFVLLALYASEPWKKLSYSRKWLKRQMNKYIRIKNKKIDADGIGTGKAVLQEKPLDVSSIYSQNYENCNIENYGNKNKS